jgi:hypothetical protein
MVHKALSGIQERHVHQTKKRRFPSEDQALYPSLVSEQPLLHQHWDTPASPATDAAADGA